MNIGETIRNYRLHKGMSQGDIEKRTGLLRCYLSRVENGHTIPSLDTLSKIAQAQYRRAANWRCIAAANPQIQDANRIFEGQELLLPANCQK